MAPHPEIETYRRSFDATWPDDMHAKHVRFAVVDSETSGTDTRKDRLYSIGAVVVEGGAICLADSFEVLIKVPYNTSSVFIHGITREGAQGGVEEEQALLQFLPWLKDAVIVGHHIGFDIEMFNIACERHFGIRLQNRTLDTMELALNLQEAGALVANNGFTLDALCEQFGITAHDRHIAQGDAFLTAQIFLKLYKIALRSDHKTLAQFCKAYERPD